MENLKLNYIQLVQHENEIKERNKKALDYIAKCNRKKNETSELENTIIGTIGCIAVVVSVYALLRCGIIL